MVVESAFGDVQGFRDIVKRCSTKSFSVEVSRAGAQECFLLHTILCLAIEALARSNVRFRSHLTECEV